MKRAAILLSLTYAGWLAGCGGEHTARETVELPRITVETVTTQRAEWPRVHEATGTVRARVTAALSAKVMGYIREITVDAGDRVKAGQLLVRLDSRDLDAGYERAQAALEEARSAMAEVENAINAAQAQLELAEVTFKRMKELYEKNSVTQQEYDEASARLRTARANHEMALSKKQQLAQKIRQAEKAVESAAVMRSYTELKAPFDGVVTERLADPGSLAAPGVPLLKLERDGSYRFEARLEESLMPRIRAGEKVSVSFDALGRSFPARITEIVPAVDAASRAFLVRIDLPSAPGLKSGLFGRARFELGARPVLAVPEGAVVRHGQLRSVFVVEEGHARARLVTLGEERDGMVEVLTGLAAGEQVVYPVPPQLVDSSPVEVRP
ncbi:MAG TPA: efflux RND transporter periplasmic adaptor subunit [Bryobacterales bacterium]|nr:efflux RND transporter periplasmic adaptor subunit [Bryobacterales bacterium]